MNKHKYCKEVQEIYGMLDFYLRNTPLGLLPFMDRSVSLPSSWEIAEILKTKKRPDDTGTKIVKGPPLPEQQQIIELSEPYTGIIEKYGGQEDIRDSFEDWGGSCSEGWKMFLDWSVKGKRGLKTMADIADNNGYNNPTTPYKLRKAYLEEIAFDIFTRFVSKRSKKFGNNSDRNLDSNLGNNLSNNL